MALDTRSSFTLLPRVHIRGQFFLALCGSMQLQRNDCHFIPLASRLNKGA